MRDKRKVIDEYNSLYRKRPNIWTDPGRDAFAFDVLYEHFSVPPATMLDIGCGSGHTIGYFHERWPGVAYTGLDLSIAAIELARQRQPYAKFIYGWLGEVDLPQYELVMILGVAEHIEDLKNGLIEARGTMTATGVMYVEVPNCIGYPTSEPREGFRRINQGNRQHEWHLHRASWEKALRQAGLDILISKQGPNITSEFVWLLVRGKHA
jgi:trans-aconitate methyltransferase